MIDYSASKMNPLWTARWKLNDEHTRSRNFLPNRPQYEFIKAAGSSISTGQRIFLLTSANGVGKTTACINIIANIIYQNINIYHDIKDQDSGEVIPGFFKFPLYNDFPEKWPKNIWYVSNQDSLTGIHKELKFWMPRKDLMEVDFLKEEKSGKHYVSQVHFFKTGWNLFYKTINQDPETFESANVSIVVFDEPPLRSQYMAAIKRLRMGGIVIIAATAVFKAGWFLDDIIDKLGDGDKWQGSAAIWDNGIKTGGNWDLGMYGIQAKGNLTAEDIDFQVRNTDPDEYDARIEGKVQRLSGLIFKSYKQEFVNDKGDKVPFHFQRIKRYPELPLYYTYRFVMDPHDRKPPCCIWLRMDRWGRIEVFREWPSWDDHQFGGKKFVDIKDSGNYTIDDFVRFWLEIEREYSISSHRIDDVIDPNFGNKINRNTGTLVYQDYMIASERVSQQLKINRTYSFIRNAEDSLPKGHKEIKEWLKPGPDGDLRLVIGSDCRNMDLAMRRYQWKDETQKREEIHGISEDVEERFKDFIDLLRYALVVPWSYTPPPKFKFSIEGVDYGEEKPREDWRRTIKRVAAERPSGPDGS